MKLKPTEIHAEWVLFTVGCVFALLAAVAAVATPPNNPACMVLAGFAFVILVGAAMTGMANNP